MVNDGQVDSAEATVAVTVTAVNDVPVANDDTATTGEGTPVTVAVLGNDTDVDGDGLTVSAVGSAGHGTVVNNTSSVTYTPAGGYSGTDSFSYTISDGQGGTATAQVTVTVTAATWALQFDGLSDFVRLAPTSNLIGSGWTTTKTHQ